MHPNPSHPAIVNGHTVYKKTVKPVKEDASVLKSGKWNEKVGGFVTKGSWRGSPIFTLTLEERATCPESCFNWGVCYGNNMPFAHRFQHGKKLENKIQSELAILSKQYPTGYVVRLHILGDFYSVEYVKFWLDMLREHRALRIFGYTAHATNSPIGSVILAHKSKRFRIRFSNNTGNLDTACNIPIPGSIQCPEQTGKTLNCGTCSFCWESDIPVYFKRH